MLNMKILIDDGLHVARGEHTLFTFENYLESSALFFLPCQSQRPKKLPRFFFRVCSPVKSVLFAIL